MPQYEQRLGNLFHLLLVLLTDTAQPNTSYTKYLTRDTGIVTRRPKIPFDVRELHNYVGSVSIRHYPIREGCLIPANDSPWVGIVRYEMIRSKPV